MFFPVLMNHFISHEDRLIPADSQWALPGQGSLSATVPAAGSVIVRVPGCVTAGPWLLAEQAFPLTHLSVPMGLRPHGPEPLPAWCLPCSTFQNMLMFTSCSLCAASQRGVETWRCFPRAVAGKPSCIPEGAPRPCP